MLLRFKVKNYRSLRDEVVLDMEAAGLFFSNKHRKKDKRVDKQSSGAKSTVFFNVLYNEL